MEPTFPFEQLLQMYMASHTRRLRHSFRHVSGCSYIIQFLQEIMNTENTKCTVSYITA